ncbi:PH domain-containing protein [Bacillus solitudinis]|uniref:PH domain-containing protein n=1 Tax=Bacillus solitudinis TaxID=2014074 RepID=UPI000C24950D|nr:PH domain-containing protein [Bacillus solitudinis]
MNELKRLHVAAIFVTFLKGLRDLIFPILISLFLGGTNNSGSFFRFEYVWLIILLFTFLYGIANWLTFRYRINNGDLYVQKGVFIKKKRYIQQQRVQSIDITAGLFQRLFGLVMVKIETAGGGTEPEINLIAVSRREAEIIRATLLFKKNNEGKSDVEDYLFQEASSPRTEVKWKLGNKRLFIAAMTSSGIGLTISAVAALFSQIEQLIPERIYERTIGLVTGSGFSFLLALVLMILIIAWLVSMLGTMLKYGSFAIEKNGEELVVTRGLIEQRQLTLQEGKITAVRLVRNIFRQPFGYTSVYVESAGGGSNEEQLSTVLIPLVHERELLQIFRTFLPHYQLEATMVKAPQRALLRFLIRNLIVPVLVTGLAIYFFSSYGFLGVILIGLMGGLALMQFRDAGSAWTEDFVWLRYRKLSQVTVIAPKRKIQAAELQESFFQRRRHLASFQISILSSIVGKSFRVRDLDSKRVEELLQWYSFKKKHDRTL